MIISKLDNMDTVKEYFSRKEHLIFEEGKCVHTHRTPSAPPLPINIWTNDKKNPLGSKTLAREPKVNPFAINLFICQQV